MAGIKIYLGADHAGFELKEKIKAFLKSRDFQVEDQGAFTHEDGDDYPDFVKIVAKMVASDPNSKGIVFGMSGQGEAMCANRFKNVRATVYYGGPDEILTLSRQHNNANILSLGAKFVSYEEATRVIGIWLTTPFSGEDRHIRRDVKLDNDPIGRRHELGDLPIDLD